LGFLDSSAPAVHDGGVLMPLLEARDRFERHYILKALAAQQGNISRTADVLGVERSNLYRKMRAFGIAPSRRMEGEEEAV
jgi:two-component system nitrogen regulation response regulator NtrX